MPTMLKMLNLHIKVYFIKIKVVYLHSDNNNI